MKDQRNRFKLYPAPKPTISAEAFKKAVVSRKRAEALAHVQAQAAALERLQENGGHGSGQQGAGDTGHPEGEQSAAMEAESQHMLKRQQEKAQRKAERQAEAEQRWREQEAERLRSLEQRQAARAELEGRRELQTAELAALKARLDGMKAQKHDLVMQLKQVLATDDMQRTKVATAAAVEDGEVPAAAQQAAPAHAASAQRHDVQPGASTAAPSSAAAAPWPAPPSTQPLPGPPAVSPLPASPALLPSYGSGRQQHVQSLPRAPSGLPLPPHLAARGSALPQQPAAPTSLPPHLLSQSSLDHRSGAG